VVVIFNYNGPGVERAGTKQAEGEAECRQIRASAGFDAAQDRAQSAPERPLPAN